MSAWNKKLFAGVITLLLIVVGVLVINSVIKAPDEVRDIAEEAVLDSALDEVVEIKKIIGTSIEGREINSYTFGQGEFNLLFVGGMHGGYEWNSILLAYEFMDYLTLNSALIPDNLKITIIPNLNPDGLFDVIGKEGLFTRAEAVAKVAPVGTGRFNANNVDLNRNFACKWAPESKWRGQTVSAGTNAFSEPESLALKTVVEELAPKAVVFWHSQASAVYASECLNGVLPQTLTLMNTYASASGYKPVASFDAYPVTGDAEGWLASVGIPAVTVEMSTHEDVEWDRNLAGFNAVLDLYKDGYGR